MVHHVIQTGGNRHDRQLRSVRRQHGHPGAEPEEDDPGILDRAVGQQSFQVVLRQRIEHAENRRERAEAHAGQAPRRAGVPRPNAQTRKSP